MWIELPVPWILAINCLGIPAAHLLVSWATTRLPASLFQSRRPGKVGASWELPLYERLFLIRRWKGRLPDAAPWFKGFSKRSLVSTDPGYLRDFIVETRRGEFSHWIQWAVITGFVAWNPYPANLVIIAYAALSNLPCIVSLRHTRLRLARFRDRHGRMPG